MHASPKSGVPSARDSDGSANTLRERLTDLPKSGQIRVLLNLIAEIVGVLTDRDSARIPVDTLVSWRRLGIYREVAGLLRSRLAAETGLVLPATLLFDRPSPAALAAYLRARILGSDDEADVTLNGPPGGVVAGDPVAVVGMACRLPGDANSPAALWELVRDGRDGIVGLPTNRGWDLDALYAPDREQPGTIYTRHGGFLPDISLFDPGFFGIGPREAAAMDPQQRLMLEITWEAFERAGVDPGSLRGSRTGVFTGVSLQDYGPPWHRAPAEVQGQLLTGNALGVVAGRVSYTFGFEGPALSVDTQCSSSLVAIHLAARSLLSGECELALAGGVTVMATPSMLLEFSRKQGLAPDGRCKPFSADADGTGWADGAGVLLLERLSDARRHGHEVLALIRGTAINQDGASNGLAAPSGSAQRRLILTALASAGLDPGDVDVLEAHGTGTALGDPIEAEAVVATYGRGRPAGRPLHLGSLKSNIGHTQAASGVAGVIKMVQAMRHGQLPRTLHVREASPHVDWSAGHVSLLTEQRPWETSDGAPRRAAVSSFGVSGTNAHLILEEAADLPETSEAPGTNRPDSTASHPRSANAPAPVPIVLSGRTAEAVGANAARLAGHLDRHLEITPLDVGLTLSGRVRFESRAVVIVSDERGGHAHLVNTLTRLAENRSSAGLISGVARPAVSGGRTAFLFTGQGSQRAGMGRLLYRAYPEFARALDEICDRFAPLLRRPLRKVMFAPAGSTDAALLDQTAYTQAALFTFETALFRLLQSWGLRPDTVVGHSIGELTAAHVAGVWTLDDACALVAARGRLMQECRPGGAMTAIRAGEADVLASIAGLAGQVEIAAVNGARSTVIAGDADAVAQVAADWTRRGTRTKRLTVSHAFHSPHMDDMLVAFRTAVQAVTYHPPSLPVMSSLTGEPATEADLMSPEYWVRQVREPVRFLDGVRGLHRDGVRAFVEIGPDAVLTALVPGCLPEDATAEDLAAVATSRAGRSEPETLLVALAELDVAGVAIDWATLCDDRGGRRVDLPTYAFQRRRYWIDGAAVPPATGAPATRPDSWRYQVRWEPLSAERAAAAAAGHLATGASIKGTWLVLTGPAGVDDRMLSRLSWLLERLGGRPVHIPLAVADAERGRLAAVLSKHSSSRDDQLGGIVSLLPFDDQPNALHPRLTNGFAFTCLVAQALDDLGQTAPYWCVTRGAVSTGPLDPVSAPAQAMVWGLGRALALERPDAWGGLLDLPATLDDEALALAGVALTAPGGEDQLAVRGGALLVPRLVPAEPAHTAAASWRPSGTVLITGGTGAIGAHAARRFARDGAARLILVSRRGPAAPGVPELVADLQALGTKVTVEACDLADRDQVTALLDRATGFDEPLTAVVHAAGVIGRVAPLRELSLGELEEVVTGKAVGAALLDELTSPASGDGVPLDAFLLISSVSATWGSGGQTGYCAGNAYLDALASHRHGRGLPATSVAFGPWAEGGLGAEPTLRDYLLRRGVAPLPAEAAVTALTEAVAAGSAATTVADVDWGRFLPPFTARRPSHFFDELSERPVRAATPPPTTGLSTGPAADDQRASLVRLTGSERDRALTSLVREEAAAILGHASPDEVALDRRFLDLGFDSLASVQLSRRLSTVIGQRLAPPVVFEHPTVTELAEYLGSLVATQDRAAPSGQLTPAGVRDLYRQACSIGRFVEGVEVLQAVAKLRPVFHDLAGFGTARPPVRLASGPAPCALVCVPSMVAPSGPHSFARLALHLHGRRNVYGLSLPGFDEGEHLPATSDLVVDLLADLIAGEFADVPVALAGYSSGGWLAHAVAAGLEARGQRPDAVVLLDTWLPGDRIPTEDIQEELRGIAVNDQAFALMTEAQVTAQGAYLTLFEKWKPSPVEAPVVLVRAQERMPQLSPDDQATIAEHGWTTDWEIEHLTLEVAGNHQTMMNEHAASTAQDLHRWLTSLDRTR
ncbi:SDR family NAD(P)-dependent oxidoreductase [Frankia sp. AgB1.9]|uniref:type I polyketide synthase n=1 Tax=unclassified Frankia TaxID=2632575 RepID=UPI0019341AA0|nr:SDR family NAD(P)-dependent oxidoreductase [Frankia sp. AgW1.1]MBL7551030.1 SDR family NAD(P)-dependent oxidoreductase [Frankia sp. AgB1.9]MBL7621189.1 SDR family NAD(P)-dependent oxidoreductase [Frankia sp. AgB1.8]